ncbi:hypothetical protein JCM14635_08100 [Megalodesulfovibrio paquesii]
MVLLKEIHRAFRTAFRDPTQHEPQLVANLVWHLPRRLNAVSLSGGNSLKAGGVFVHAQPFVTAPSFPAATPASVEIGDLLLLRTAYNAGSAVDRRAMLLQAKKTATLPAKPDNKNQYHLYAQWPRFEYVRSTPHLNGETRHVRGPDLYDAAKYLLLCGDTHPEFPCCCAPGFCYLMRGYCYAMTAHPTEPHLTHHRCFARDVLEFIMGDSGKTYNERVHHFATGWDKVIEDLTTITAERHSKFMGRASGGTTRARGGMMALHFLSGEMPFFSRLSHLGFSVSDFPAGMDGPPDVPARDREDNEEGGRGISILEFAINAEGPPRA